MDVAQTQHGTELALLTMSQYLQLPPHQRPTQLWCAGTADHGLCRGPVFPKAVGGTVIAAHFASLHHAPGCDHAAPSHADRARLPTPGSEPAVLRLMPTARTRGEPLPWLAHRYGRHDAGDPRAGLSTALRALMCGGLPDELLVQWQQQPPMLAYEFFIHLTSATIARDEPRGYWGRIGTVGRHEQTGSTHLTPRDGARVVIDAATSSVLQSQDPSTAQALSEAAVLAVGPLRRARSGRLYVLIKQPGAITWL